MLQHTDDDGALSVFASKDQVLIACAKGHYWLLDATQHQVSEEADGESGGRRPPGSRGIAELSADFGPAVARGLGLT
ncbi:hypothetical protein [Phycicoccus avicenniae]|uniref:hypothetical protein n=1 Tax=Phycicoccus avicenniae TaxID=2828860 RepID=UPI003D27008A